MILPTFFVVGAPKAGTTSLHEYLAEHPQIAMSSDKEPMCFTGSDWERRIERYAALFERDAPVRGESSTAYSAFPWEPEVPDRVLATVPDARVIYLVRDPVGRTLAHYAQNVWNEFPVRPFDELMDDLEDPLNMPVWCSRYGTQLARWMERFEHVLVLDQRALLRDRAATLRRVFAFLGVDERFSSPAWGELHNAAPSHRVPNGLARALGGRALAAARAGRLPRLLTRPVGKPALREDQRLRLEALLAPEARRLRELTGLALEHWSV